jgi:hypothetical protein
MPTEDHVVALAPLCLEALHGPGHMHIRNLLDLGDKPTHLHSRTKLDVPLPHRQRPSAHFARNDMIDRRTKLVCFLLDVCPPLLERWLLVDTMNTNVASRRRSWNSWENFL